MSADADADTDTDTDIDAGATLELTFLLSSADGLRLKPPTETTTAAASALTRKTKPFIVAWVDPAFKKSTPRRNSRSEDDPKLHFPLTAKTLGDPSSSLTIQILTSRRLPFLRSPAAAAKIEGSATVPLSCLPAAASGGTILTLPLRRPCGRETGGWVRVTVRLLWCLGPVPADGSVVDRVNGVPTAADAVPSNAGGEMELYWPEPSAPPLPPEGNCPVPMVALQNSLAESCGEVEFSRVDRNEPLLTEGNRPVVAAGDSAAEEGDMELCEVQKSVPTVPEGNGREQAFRSFLLGLASGTVASFLVGAARLFDG